MYLKFDPRSRELELDLPAKLQPYEGALQQALSEAFAFEALNRSTLQEMNSFLLAWFKEQGIELDGSPAAESTQSGTEGRGL